MNNKTTTMNFGQPIRFRRMGNKAAANFAWRWTAFCVMLSCTAGCSRGITPIQTAFNRGVYHYSNGHYDQAIHEYRKAIGENPRDERARFNLAITLEEKGQHVDLDQRSTLRQEAEEHYRKIAHRDPEHLRANVNLAALDHECGKTERAIKRLQKIAAVHPSSGLPRRALGVIYFRGGRHQDAEQMLREAVRLDPASVEGNMLYGDSLKAQNRIEDAAQAYRRALATRPDDLAVLLSLARLEESRGHHEDARVLLQRVVYINADHHEAHLRLANVSERTGNFEKAAYHLWAARQLDHQRPKNHPTTNYTQRLRNIYQQLIEFECTNK